MNRFTRNFHWIAGLLLALALAPLARLTGFPLRFEWLQMLLIGPAAFAVDGILFASILYLATNPKDCWKKLQNSGTPVPFPGNTLAGIGALCLYLGWSFGLVLAYNDIIAAMRFDGRADATLARADEWLLRGGSVQEWAHSVLRSHSEWFGRIEFIYLLMFSFIAACVITLAVSEGPQRAFDFVATGLTASYLSLGCFYAIPAVGPYLLDHSSIWPTNSMVYGLQNGAAAGLLQFARGFRPASFGADYFVAFPCMHLVEVILMWWFVKDRHKGLALVLAIYGIILVPCIFLLEEHYVVDVLASFPVAVIAILAVDRGAMLRERSGEPALMA